MDRVDSSSIVDIIFSTFLKVFDVVNHCTICSKLRMLGVRGKLLLGVVIFLLVAQCVSGL